MPTTVLYDYWRSSAAYRVRIALNLLGLPFRPVPIDLVAGEQRGADNLARNPQGLVPTLEIDGIRLTQSIAILEYLDETRRAGWLPNEPESRARVRSVAYAVAMDIHPVCNLRVARHAVSLGATMEGWMQHFITLGLAGVEGLLQQQTDAPFCCGDRVTLADICLVPQVYNARRWGWTWHSSSGDACLAGLDRLSAFQAAHPDLAKPGE